MILLALWPFYLAYGVTFLFIGQVWANHHLMFDYIRARPTSFRCRPPLCRSWRGRCSGTARGTGRNCAATRGLA
jgi:hypothetical protein